MSILTTSSWLELGHSAQELNRRLADGSLTRLRNGVLLTEEPTDHTDLHGARIHAIAPYLAPGTFVSHHSAAMLNGVAMLGKPPDRVHVTRTLGGHGYRNRVLHSHRGAMDVGDTELLEGIPVTSLRRTAGDLARCLPFADAVVALDSALARGLGREELGMAVDGGRNPHRAGRAAAFADGRSESPGESWSRALMEVTGIPIPELQRELWDAWGRFLARVDFYWAEQRVVGEFDGLGKYSAHLAGGDTVDRAIQREKEREAALADEGYRVVRWMWSDLSHPGLLAARWRRALGVPLAARPAA